MASIFLALRNPEKLKTRFPGSLRLRRPPVELRAETNFTRTSVLPSTVRSYCRATGHSIILVQYGVVQSMTHNGTIAQLDCKMIKIIFVRPWDVSHSSSQSNTVCTECHVGIPRHKKYNIYLCVRVRTVRRTVLASTRTYWQYSTSTIGLYSEYPGTVRTVRYCSRLQSTVLSSVLMESASRMSDSPTGTVATRTRVPVLVRTGTYSTRTCTQYSYVPGNLLVATQLLSVLQYSYVRTVLVPYKYGVQYVLVYVLVYCRTLNTVVVQR